MFFAFSGATWPTVSNLSEKTWSTVYDLNRKKPDMGRSGSALAASAGQAGAVGAE